MKIFITGGSGSLGSEICKQLVNQDSVSEIIVFSRHEFSQVDLKEKVNNKKIKIVLGDILDFNNLLMSSIGADVIIHAAAVKHIDIAENNPIVASEINVTGTSNVVKCAKINNIKQLIMISTDKASNPSGVYGYSKKLGEDIVINSSSDKNIMCAIRFGNIIGSSGSIFQKWVLQNNLGNKITLTSKEMTRFFISVEQAAEFVISKINKFKGKEIFIPKMKSAKIYDLAKYIAKSDNMIEIIGIRKNEKIHEEIISEREYGLIKESDNEIIIYPSNSKAKTICSNNSSTWFSPQEIFDYIR